MNCGALIERVRSLSPTTSAVSSKQGESYGLFVLKQTDTGLAAECRNAAYGALFSQFSSYLRKFSLRSKITPCENLYGPAHHWIDEDLATLRGDQPRGTSRRYVCQRCLGRITCFYNARRVPNAPKFKVDDVVPPIALITWHPFQTLWLRIILVTPAMCSCVNAYAPFYLCHILY